MPFRNPGERIAKVGQGFSRLLAMVNPSPRNDKGAASTYSFNQAKSVIKTRVPQVNETGPLLNQIPEVVQRKTGSRNAFQMKNQKVLTQARKSQVGVKTANNSGDEESFNQSLLEATHS